MCLVALGALGSTIPHDCTGSYISRNHISSCWPLLPLHHRAISGASARVASARRGVSDGFTPKPSISKCRITVFMHQPSTQVWYE